MLDEEHVRQSSLIERSDILLSYLQPKVLVEFDCVRPKFIQGERLCKGWYIHLTQNTVSLYNMDSSSRYNPSIWTYTPAPRLWRTKLKSKEVLYSANESLDLRY